MNGVRPKVTDCYNQFKVPGTAMVNVVIGKNGKVTHGDGDRQVRGHADRHLRRGGGQDRQLPAVGRVLDAVPVPAEVAGRDDDDADGRRGRSLAALERAFGALRAQCPSAAGAAAFDAACAPVSTLTLGALLPGARAAR